MEPVIGLLLAQRFQVGDVGRHAVLARDQGDMRDLHGGRQIGWRAGVNFFRERAAQGMFLEHGHPYTRKCLQRSLYNQGLYITRTGPFRAH
jgi:hypothetical protein